MPEVSIIMPAYNVEQTIAESIESVNSQSFTDWELIVCDDGSTDATVAVVSRYLSDPRIQLIRSSKNSGGASQPRNRAIVHSSGRWIAFLDADDLWLPQKLEKQLTYLRHHPEVVLVHCSYRILENGKLRRPRYLPTRKYEVEGNIHDLLIWKNRIGTHTVVVDREVLDQAGLFDESLHLREDQDLWIRVSRYGPFGYLKELLAISRGHSGVGVFRSEENLPRAEKSMLQISDRYTKGNPKARVKSLTRVYGVLGALYLENGNKVVARQKLKLALHYAVIGFDLYVLLVLKLLLQTVL